MFTEKVVLDLKHDSKNKLVGVYSWKDKIVYIFENRIITFFQNSKEEIYKNSWFKIEKFLASEDKIFLKGTTTINLEPAATNSKSPFLVDVSVLASFNISNQLLTGTYSIELILTDILVIKNNLFAIYLEEGTTPSLKRYDITDEGLKEAEAHAFEDLQDYLEMYFSNNLLVRIDLNEISCVKLNPL